MRKLLGATVLLTGAAWAAWTYWRAQNQANAEAWAAATDKID